MNRNTVSVMKMKIYYQKSKRTRAFSLIEVTLAMAIAAVALVTLLGMIPQGLSTMNEAADLAIGGRIQQQVLNEVQMADFDVIDRYDGMVVYYDSQGEEIESQGGGDGATPPEGTVYSARVVIQPPIPGQEFIRPVTIQIAATGERGGFDWDSEKTRYQRTTHQTMVVRMGKVEL